MNVTFPMTVSLQATRLGGSVDLRHEGPALKIEHRYHCVLRADKHAQIQLSSGTYLRDVGIDFTLFCGVQTSRELSADLAPTDVGFLFHSSSGSANALAKVHGGALLAGNYLPSVLFVDGMLVHISLTLANVPVVLEGAPPFTWHPDRKGLIRLSAISLSFAQKDGAA